MSTPPPDEDLEEVVLTEVSSAKDLMPYVQLVDVLYYEVQGTRLMQPREDLRDAPPFMLMQASVSEEPANFWVRMRLELTSVDGEYVVDAAAHYKLAKPVKITEDVAKDFVDKVGIFNVYPYLREGLHSLQGKLRLTHTTLGVINQGMLQATHAAPGQQQ